VHRLDAARLFRLAVEAAPAGSRRRAAGAEGVPFREIAEAIGHQLKLPVDSVAAEDAGDHFSVLPAFVPLDNPTSSALTRERLVVTSTTERPRQSRQAHLTADVRTSEDSTFYDDVCFCRLAATAGHSTTIRSLERGSVRRGNGGCR
jgi:nucleoside-diphosphate-sugar epimerase